MWAPFHERMPVVLPGDLLDDWLAGAGAPVAELLSLPVDLSVEPFPSATPPQPSLFD